MHAFRTDIQYQSGQPFVFNLLYSRTSAKMALDGYNTKTQCIVTRSFNTSTNNGLGFNNGNAKGMKFVFTAHMAKKTCNDACRFVLTPCAVCVQHFAPIRLNAKASMDFFGRLKNTSTHVCQHYHHYFFFGQMVTVVFTQHVWYTANQLNGFIEQFKISSFTFQTLLVFFCSDVTTGQQVRAPRGGKRGTRRGRGSS